MDQVNELTQIVQSLVESYARPAYQASAYAYSDTNHHHYSVLVFPDYPRKFKAGIVVAARVTGNRVIIDEDRTDRPLVDELVRAGIPREQIVLTYAGEKLPEHMEG